MFKKLKLLFVSFIALFALISVGLSDFVLSGSITTNLTVDKDSETPVCYNKTTGVYYNKVENALKAAQNSTTAETIYVIPGKNPTILTNCTLSSEDTLILPYEGENWDDRNGTSTKENQFADCTEANISANKKSDVKIGTSSGTSVTLTINGTLNVGGILGCKVQGLSGFTSSSYAQISLYKNAQIIVNGTLDLRGYIKEADFSNASSGLVINKNATFNLPFVVYDYAGGSATAGIYAAGTEYLTAALLGKEISPNGSAFPFNLFDCPNCQVLTKIFAGSSTNGYISLYTQEKSIAELFDFKESWNTESISLIGSSISSILYLKAGYLNIRFTKTNKVEATDVTAKANTTVIDAYGNFELGSLNMAINAQICTVSINTSNVYFPMSYHFEVNVKSGYTLTNSNKLKIMGDANLNIEQGASLSNSGTIIVYNTSYTDIKTRVPYIPTYDSSYKVTSNKCEVNDFGNLTINGTYTSESSSSIGGKLTTTKENATLNLNSGYNSSASSLEHNGTTDYLTSKYLKVSFIATDEVTITENLKIKEFNDLNVNDYADHSASGTYKSAYGLNNNLGFGTSSATMSILGSDSIALDGAAATYTLSTGNLIGNSVTWESSDPNVATVSGSGLSASVTPVSEGTTTLTATVYNGSSFVQDVTKTIKIKGNSINVIIKDTAGNTIYSTSTENSLSYTVNLSDYVVYSSKQCTNSYSLPDYKVLQTITNWTMTNETQGTTTTPTSSTTSLTVSGKSGDTITIQAVGSQTYFYLAYMTEHANDGTSYLSTSYALDESNKSTKSDKLESAKSYCYIQVGQKYTLSATGSKISTDGYSTTITDGTNTITAKKGSWGNANTVTKDDSMGSSVMTIKSYN